MRKAQVDGYGVTAAPAYAVANKNQLGSGAGYGYHFPMNRYTYHRAIEVWVIEIIILFMPYE